MGLVILFAFVVSVVSLVFRAFRHRLHWETGVLQEHDHPFDLGETRIVNYRAIAKKAKLLDQLNIKVSLRCQELVRYRRGTDHVTKREDLAVLPVEFTRNPDDLAVSLQCKVTIPTDLPPSLDLRHNNINWIIEVDIDTPAGMDMKSKFDITVQPQVRAAGSMGYEPEVVAPREWDDGSRPLPPTPGNFYE